MERQKGIAMKSVINCIRNRVSAEALYQGVQEVSTYHRIQGSDGFRDAALFLCNKLNKLGIETNILSFPADGETWFGANRMFKEWNCRSGWLKLTDSDALLADFSADPISIIQRSHACDYRNQPLDLVYLDRGAAEKSYEDIDLKGKLVFYQGPFKDIQSWAVGKKGAVGIVTDCIYEIPGVRTRHDLYDIKNYTSFWWKHDGTDNECFGYVLTPRQGDKLAAQCLKQRERHKQDPSEARYLQCHCFIDAELFAGEIEVVEAVIPGTTDEELLLVSHLCHPRPSANDNASGVSASVEALRVLTQMIADKTLAPLRRGVRAIFVPEFTGIYPWLESRGEKFANLKAGLNLDMVGGKISLGYGPLTLSGIPDTSDSFVVSLATAILHRLGETHSAHSGMDQVSSFPYAFTEFDPGSDNYILCDPTVNLPTPMLGQWPDPNYHTSGDNLSVIDPQLMVQSASLAASYLYLLSNLDVATVGEVLLASISRFNARLASQFGHLFWNEPSQFARGVSYLAELFMRQNNALIAFFPDDDPDLPLVQAHLQKTADIINGMVAVYGGSEENRAKEKETEREKTPRDSVVWIRLYRTPLSHTDDHFKGDRDLYAAYRQYEEKYRKNTPNAYRIESMVQFGLNGSDAFAELLEKVGLQSKQDPAEIADMVWAYLEMLEKLALVKRKESAI
jgi:aminopeptidase YwaD